MSGNRHLNSLAALSVIGLAGNDERRDRGGTLVAIRPLRRRGDAWSLYLASLSALPLDNPNRHLQSGRNAGHGHVHRDRDLDASQLGRRDHAYSRGQELSLLNYVVAVGSDGYEAVFSGGELNPMFGGRTAAPDMIAYADTAASSAERR